jgi:hypothetical protein
MDLLCKTTVKQKQKKKGLYLTAIDNHRIRCEGPLIATLVITTDYEKIALITTEADKPH